MRVFKCAFGVMIAGLYLLAILSAVGCDAAPTSPTEVKVVVVTTPIPSRHVRPVVNPVQFDLCKLYREGRIMTFTTHPFVAPRCD